MTRKLSILIIDDSPTIRAYLNSLLQSKPEIGRIDLAQDPYEAVEKIRAHKPDVISLDIEMPKMDGITFLKKLMNQHPIPVIVFSSLVEKKGNVVIEASNSGAFSILCKPNALNLHQMEEIFYNEVLSAADADLSDYWNATGLTKGTNLSETKNRTEVRSRSVLNGKSHSHIIAIGSSTGGAMALNEILVDFTPDMPGTLIVQHMPKEFTGYLASRLNEKCDVEVREAKDGDKVQAGLVLIAPGDQHMIVKGSYGNYRVNLLGGDPVNRHKPSVDVLFDSVAKVMGSEGIGIILTGMGKDGAKGLLNIKNQNGYTIAQNEDSCVVFGMPKAALNLKAVNKSTPLSLITKELMVVLGDSLKYSR